LFLVSRVVIVIDRSYVRRISRSLLHFLSYFSRLSIFFFFFNSTATTEIYTLSLHDALPISCLPANLSIESETFLPPWRVVKSVEDRKSTRLNSSHGSISYAVFCLKKKNKNKKRQIKNTRDRQTTRAHAINEA